MTARFRSLPNNSTVPGTWAGPGNGRLVPFGSSHYPEATTHDAPAGLHQNGHRWLLAPKTKLEYISISFHRLLVY